MAIGCAARLEAVITTAAMDEASRSAWRREHGVYPQQLQQWRESATQAPAEPEEARASPQQTRHDRGRIKELEREVRRKDKALAETAALLADAMLALPSRADAQAPVAYAELSGDPVGREEVPQVVIADPVHFALPTLHPQVVDFSNPVVVHSGFRHPIRLAASGSANSRKSAHTKRIRSITPAAIGGTRALSSSRAPAHFLQTPVGGATAVRLASSLSGCRVTRDDSLSG